MNSNNNTTWESCGNDFASLQINRNNELNYQHPSGTISNINHHNCYVYTAASESKTFEFYFPLPNDTRIYHVTYTELNQDDIARRLNYGNNGINLSPNYQIPHHYNVQNLIQQQIAQRNCCSNCNCNRQDTIIIQPDNAYVKSFGPSNMQNAEFEGSLQQNNFQQY